MFTTERVFVNKNKRESSEESLNVSFASNNSFYNKLNIETKRDIIHLIKSGYNKRIVIKLYLFLNPSNLNEAVQYLSKENGINQHIFYESLNKEDICEICGEKQNLHINEKDKTINISFNSICISNRNENENIYKIKSKEEKNKICKICDDDITKDEELNNKCEQCNSYFCNECLYLHIKELIKNGNYALYCPECKNIYTKNKIEQIFSLSKDKELNNLKILLEKNNTKEIILSNPELMFCPIVNCNGFAKKNNDKDYNICNMGHKFCNKCGEKYHENEKCKEEENIDKLFEEFSRKYNLKNCPYCKIVVIKKGGCNHMNCKYCGKHWCWLCNEIFISTEEHYGNINSKCYNMMMNNNEIIRCDKCDNEINNNSFRTFRCDHRICNNCLIEYLLGTCVMIICPGNIINCLVEGCKNIGGLPGDRFVEFINNSNNEKLIKKYKVSILFYEYNIKHIFRICTYMDVYEKFCNLVAKLFSCCWNSKCRCILEGILTILLMILFLIYIFIVPFPLIISKRIYYYKLLPEIRNRYNNKFITFTIIISEEILTLVLILYLLLLHYLYFCLFVPISLLIILLRNLYYKIPVCS